MSRTGSDTKANIKGGAKKILFVASLGRNHILKFHVPTIKALTDRGWIVDVACAGKEPVPYVRNRYTMSWQRSPFTAGTFKGIRELKKILAEEHYDVVYCHTPVGGLATRLAAGKARKEGTKVIYCAHGLHFYKGAPIKNWLVYFPVEKYLSAKSDAIFTVNDEDYETAKKHFSRKAEIRRVPEVGVDFSRLNVNNPAEIRKKIREELKIPEDAYVMIYVADVVPNKNQGMLIDALKTVRGQGYNMYLVLPGPECDEGACERYAGEQGMAEYCRFLGWRSDIGELMYSADICTASSIREGFGLSLVEAMYCGLPVVATDNRGHRMIIRDKENGFLVPVNDAEKMAERVKQLIGDAVLRQRLSVQNTDEYDCRKVAERLSAEIEEIEEIVSKG